VLEYISNFSKTLENMAQNPNWLDADDWKWVQDTMPIACCDVVPVQVGSDGRAVERIGLIYRNTPHQGMRWCVVGGRIWRGESLAQAAGRQLRETLGPAIGFEVEADRQPDFVVQYFTTVRPHSLLDPRQHAITSMFVVPIEGMITAMGEAESFRWFDRNALPASQEFGFEQDKAIAATLKRWEAGK
jgi:ADP-ribose pyrophosphatase YjhB (NUDIX family)